MEPSHGGGSCCFLVAAPRGRHPQPPVPEHGGTTRPDVRLVRVSHPLPGSLLGVCRNAWKMSITSAVGGRYLGEGRGWRILPSLPRRVGPPREIGASDALTQMTARHNSVDP